MAAFGERIGYFLGHPQAIIYGVATALLYPVLIAEVIALLVIVFEVGRFTVETYRRWQVRRRIDLELVASAAQADGAANPAAALGLLEALSSSPVARKAKASLGDGMDLTRPRVLKALADAELEATRALERTRVMIRFGPILGLMGTLIPISPALVGLAKGDVNSLSSNLVVAFSTTVVGLLIGGLGYMVTTVRDRYYQQDVVDLEYVFDRMEV